MSKLNILVNDNGAYPALIARLAAEGHCVYVTYPQNLPPGEQPGYLPGDGSYLTDKQILSGTTNLDLYIGFELEDTLGRSLQMLGIPVLCHSQDVYALETNRELGAAFIRKHAPSIKIVEALEFDTRDAAIKALKNSKDKVVLKPSPKSVGHATNDLRCHFSSKPHTQGIEVLRRDPGYFDDQGNGGVRLERFITGVETCLGALFNGHDFDTMFYVCHEHKDATNGNRSGVLTGEVGTSLTWHHVSENPKIAEILKGVAKGLRNSETRGFIDLNLMLCENGDVYLIEWTCRWGRPTLEMILATYKGDFGRYLHKAALCEVLGSGAEDFWAAALGVVAFPYGYPVVEREHQLVTYRGRKARRDGTQFLPMISIMLTQSVALCDDRFGIAVAVADRLYSDTIPVLQNQCQELLEAQTDLPNRTWRDDIGSHWEHDLGRAELCLDLHLNRGFF